MLWGWVIAKINMRHHLWRWIYWKWYKIAVLLLVIKLPTTHIAEKIKDSLYARILVHFPSYYIPNVRIKYIDWSIKTICLKSKFMDGNSSDNPLSVVYEREIALLDKLWWRIGILLHLWPAHQTWITCKCFWYDYEEKDFWEIGKNLFSNL